jgi:hypothetical protein
MLVSYLPANTRKLGCALTSILLSLDAEVTLSPSDQKRHFVPRVTAVSPLWVTQPQHIVTVCRLWQLLETLCGKVQPNATANSRNQSIPDRLL